MGEPDFESQQRLHNIYTFFWRPHTKFLEITEFAKMIFDLILFFHCQAGREILSNIRRNKNEG